MSTREDVTYKGPLGLRVLRVVLDTGPILEGEPRGDSIPVSDRVRGVYVRVG